MREGWSWLSSMKSLLVALLAGVVALLTGCSSVTRSVASGVDFTQVRSIWVEQRLADNHNVRDRLVRALRAHGYDADAGPLTMMPDRGVDAVLVYQDRWTWDFRSYMMELEAELRHPRNQALMAQVFIHQLPFRGYSTDGMAEKAIQTLLPRGSAPAPAVPVGL
jgi:hypothetical protein